MSLDPQTLFDGVIVLIAVVAAFATWQNSKSAKKSSEETDALTTIKIKDETIRALTSENTFLKTQNSKYGERIAVLEAENTKLQALVQNRNPELDIFMKNTTSSLLLIERSIEALLKAQPANITVNNQPASQHG